MHKYSVPRIQWLFQNPMAQIYFHINALYLCSAYSSYGGLLVDYGRISINQEKHQFKSWPFIGGDATHVNVEPLSPCFDGHRSKCLSEVRQAQLSYQQHFNWRIVCPTFRENMPFCSFNPVTIADSSLNGRGPDQLPEPIYHEPTDLSGSRLTSLHTPTMAPSINGWNNSKYQAL